MSLLTPEREAELRLKSDLCSSVSLSRPQVRELWSHIDAQREQIQALTKLLGVDVRVEAARVAALTAQREALRTALRDLNECHHGWHIGAGRCICGAHEAASAALALSAKDGYK